MEPGGMATWLKLVIGIAAVIVVITIIVVIRKRRIKKRNQELEED
jgi:Flp pilus assembly protein TadB